MVRYALVAFNGEAMCFTHVLLNALDMKSRGHEVTIIVEGSATKLIAAFNQPDAPFHGLWRKVVDGGLIGAACKACCAKMGSLESAQQQGLPIDGEMSGHPPIARWLDDGWRVLTF